MPRAKPNSDASRTASRHVIVRELEAFLSSTHLRHVHFADDTVPAPPLAFVTHFPRLSIPLAGKHNMQLARHGEIQLIRPDRGHAVFVPGNAWNKPDWSASVRVLTFLFGTKHIGVSMVAHQVSMEIPRGAVKTSIDGSYDRLTQSLLNALLALAADAQKGPLVRLITESLLHACLQLLKNPSRHRYRKGARTYDSICLYVQQNFQLPLTRASVSRHFGLASNHVSRLFRREGLVRFNDYLNLVRVSRAKYLLRKSKVSLKEIATQCGYSDLPYFCRAFKRLTKSTPSQYRARS